MNVTHQDPPLSQSPVSVCLRVRRHIFAVAKSNSQQQLLLFGRNVLANDCRESSFDQVQALPRIICAVAASATGTMMLLFFSSSIHEMCQVDNLTYQWGAGSYLCVTGATFWLVYGVAVGLSIKPATRRAIPVKAVEAIPAATTSIYDQVPSSPNTTATTQPGLVGEVDSEGGGDLISP